MKTRIMVRFKVYFLLHVVDKNTSTFTFWIAGRGLFGNSLKLLPKVDAI